MTEGETPFVLKPLSLRNIRIDDDFLLLGSRVPEIP